MVAWAVGKVNSAKRASPRTRLREMGGTKSGRNQRRAALILEAYHVR